MFIFIALVAIAQCNIWDNIVVNSEAPYVQLDDNFQATVQVGNFINNSFFLSFNSQNNSIKADYSISISDTLNLSSLNVNFTANKFSVTSNGQCYLFEFPEELSIPISLPIAFWQLFTQYVGVVDDEYVFKFSNILDASIMDADIFLCFSRKTRKISKIKVASNNVVYLKADVHNYMNLTSFPEHYFDFNSTCIKGNSEAQGRFNSLFKIAAKYGNFLKRLIDNASND